MCCQRQTALRFLQRWLTSLAAGASCTTKVAPLRRASTVDVICPRINHTQQAAHAQAHLHAHKQLFKPPLQKSQSRLALATHKLFPPSVRAVKTIAIILGTFYLCYLPLLIYILAFKNSYSNFVINVLASLALINSLLNPLIYGFKNRGIRLALTSLIRCRKQRRGSETTSLALATAYQPNH